MNEKFCCKAHTTNKTHTLFNQQEDEIRNKCKVSYIHVKSAEDDRKTVPGGMRNDDNFSIMVPSADDANISTGGH